MTQPMCGRSPIQPGNGGVSTIEHYTDWQWDKLDTFDSAVGESKQQSILPRFERLDCSLASSFSRSNIHCGQSLRFIGHANTV